MPVSLRSASQLRRSSDSREVPYTVGTKDITDLYPGCAVAQLDNFTTDPRCSGIPDLGNFMTIKLS
jgi:hypothetical protein